MSLLAKGLVLVSFFALPVILRGINPGWFACIALFGGFGIAHAISFFVALSVLIPSVREGRLKRFFVGVFFLICPLFYFALVMAGATGEDYCRGELAYPQRDPASTLFYLWLGSGVSVALHVMMRRGKSRR